MEVNVVNSQVILLCCSSGLKLEMFVIHPSLMHCDWLVPPRHRHWQLFVLTELVGPPCQQHTKMMFSKSVSLCIFTKTMTVTVGTWDSKWNWDLQKSCANQIVSETHLNHKMQLEFAMEHDVRFDHHFSNDVLFFKFNRANSSAVIVQQKSTAPTGSEETLWILKIVCP